MNVVKRKKCSGVNSGSTYTALPSQPVLAGNGCAFGLEPRTLFVGDLNALLAAPDDVLPSLLASLRARATVLASLL